MSIFRAIILGIIQGIAEFLPISSSAHLILFPYLFGWEESSLAFDVALHFGTMMAVLVVFFKDWWVLFTGAVKGIVKKEKSTNGKIFWYLVVATIPAALSGLLLDEIVENVIRNKIWIIAIALAVMGLLIFLGDKWASKHYKKETKFEDITLKQSFLVGISQAFAVIPGFSRSGTTILAGRLMGLSKEAITKFTFLLSVPVISGATILKIGDLNLTKEVIIGIISSFAMGIISIKFLLSYIKKHDFSVFAFYRVILAIIVLVKLIFF
ncbi:MAG: undecaprenyl-diphosphatase UppP [Bacilli bacterium]|nr:undecaprenyl-diphosphatase UppP [Bacilli bacterium]